MRIASFAGAVAATAAACLFATNVSAMELRYNRWLPPTHHLDNRVLKPYFDKIAEVTDGRVTVTFTSSSLGGLERQHELAVMGIADVALVSESVTPGQFPLAEIVEMPGIGEDNEAVSVAYWRTYERFFEEKNPYPDVHLLTLATLPPYHIYNAERPVESIEDMEGLKIRAAGVLASEKVRALGGTVVPAQVTQFLELISKGVIDGCYFTDDGVYVFGFLDTLKYKTQFKGGLGGLSISLVMNKAKWDQISPEDQAAITTISGEELARKIGVSYNQSIAEAQAAISKAGIETTVADDAFMAEVRERLAPLEDEWIAKANKLGVDGAAALNMLRTEAQNYTE
ncbi:TRAP transporter substrate-binding protein [Amorphus sp. 3PC139-8]|uniref:TRAP transporter substrate-binding protein n=1 Tax=Amorphus sp. 3PC139-8 TaxID=2735676 RepID=UPI00345CF4A4